MPVVHVAHGDLSATIYPVTGVAILSNRRIYQFSYANGRNGAGCESSKELPGLPWDNCVKLERSGPVNLNLIITLQDAQNIHVVVVFNGLVGPHLKIRGRVERLEQWFGRALSVHRKLKLRQQQEKLEVLGMGLHPRLGASSPITVDILQMVAEHSLV